MKALHIFPLFGPELTNGSEYYEYMLSQKLVGLGVDVDVFTTRSRQFRPTSFFSIEWPNDYHQGVEYVDGMKIFRFPVTLSLPSLVGRGISRVIRSQWRGEENTLGIMVKGSKNLEDYYYRRALARPVIYDWMTMLGLGPWSLPLLVNMVRRIQLYDILLVGFMPLALIWQVTHIARIFKKPVVILALFHPDDLYHHHKSFYRCFTAADAVLTQTPYSTELFTRLFPSARPFQIGAGVEARLFQSPEISGKRFRGKYGLSDKKIVLFVGRKERFKRYDLAVEAIDLIGDDQIKLVMVGSDVDQQPIHSPNIVYLRKLPREDLLDAYDACDVFLLPSEHESFGMVFLEAWMRQKPVIGNTLCKPVASLIRDGVDGYVCASAKEIADRIKHLVGDPDLARRLGEAGYRRVMEQYTWDTIASKVYCVYNEIIDDSRAELSLDRQT